MALLPLVSKMCVSVHMPVWAHSFAFSLNIILCISLY